MDMIKWIRRQFNRARLEIKYRRRLKELKKRDPFLYK